MRIANNTAAFNVWTSYTENLDNLKLAMNHLSTGMKTIVDDPAGMGISERLRAQAAGTAMARENVENGISLTQTADSWLQNISDMLSRMSELAIEADDGSKSETDLANIQTEFKEMQEEITRITSKYTAAAKFNGLFLFRGGNGRSGPGDTIEAGDISLQVGPDIDQNISLSLENLQVTNSEVIGTAVSFAYNSHNVITASTRLAVEWSSIIDVNKLSVSAEMAIGKISEAINFVSNARASMGAQQKRLEYTRSALLTYEDNIRAAESKIRDVDMARESTQFTKYQILTQSSSLMLAQANQLPSRILSLLE